MSDSNGNGKEGVSLKENETVWVFVDVNDGIIQAVHPYRRHKDAIAAMRKAMDEYDKPFHGAGGRDPRENGDWSGESYSSGDGDTDLYVWSSRLE